MITIYQCVNWILCYRVGLHPAPGPATGQAEWSAGGIQAGRGAPCQLWGMKEGSPPPLGDPAETSKTRLFPEEHLLCFEGWRDREF